MAENVLAVVPARGGSKRIPDKNLQLVGDKPLVAHAIEDGTSAQSVNLTVLSSDSEEIQRVARESGASVPFTRPRELATDEASTSAVITHAIHWYRGEGQTFDTVCCLQPTSPLRTAKDVDEALNRFHESAATSLVSVTPYTQEPQWALRESASGYLEERYEPETMFTDEYVREQDLDDLWFPNGAIFVADVSTWLDRETFYTERTMWYEMPPERSLEVDEPWHLDLVRAYVGYDSSTFVE